MTPTSHHGGSRRRHHRRKKFLEKNCGIAWFCVWLLWMTERRKVMRIAFETHFMIESLIRRTSLCTCVCDTRQSGRGGPTHFQRVSLCDCDRREETLRCRHGPCGDPIHPTREFVDSSCQILWLSHAFYFCAYSIALCM